MRRDDVGLLQPMKSQSHDLDLPTRRTLKSPASRTARAPPSDKVLARFGAHAHRAGTPDRPARRQAHPPAPSPRRQGDSELRAGENTNAIARTARPTQTPSWPQHVANGTRPAHPSSDGSSRGKSSAHAAHLRLSRQCRCRRRRDCIGGRRSRTSASAPRISWTPFGGERRARFFLARISGRAPTRHRRCAAPTADRLGMVVEGRAGEQSRAVWGGGGGRRLRRWRGR